MGSKRRIFSATECVLAVQGHSGTSKVDDFGTNRKRVCDFLLVINSNFGPILHRFRDTTTYWPLIRALLDCVARYKFIFVFYLCKNCLFFLPLSHSAPWLPRFPLDYFPSKLTTRKLVMGLSYSEDPMIVAGVVLTQCQRVTDGQTETDRRTDLR